MLTLTELQALILACKTEVWYLQKADGDGIPTMKQQALVTSARAKLAEMVDQATKAAVAPAPSSGVKDT